MPFKTRLHHVLNSWVYIIFLICLKSLSECVSVFIYGNNEQLSDLLLKISWCLWWDIYGKNAECRLSLLYLVPEKSRKINYRFFFFVFLFFGFFILTHTILLLGLRSNFWETTTTENLYSWWFFCSVFLGVDGMWKHN